MLEPLKSDLLEEDTFLMTNIKLLRFDRRLRQLLLEFYIQMLESPFNEMVYLNKQIFACISL